MYVITKNTHRGSARTTCYVSYSGGEAEAWVFDSSLMQRWSEQQQLWTCRGVNYKQSREASCCSTRDKSSSTEDELQDYLAMGLVPRLQEKSISNWVIFPGYNRWTTTCQNRGPILKPFWYVVYVWCVWLCVHLWLVCSGHEATLTVGPLRAAAPWIL